MDWKIDDAMSLIQTLLWAAVQCKLAGWTQEVLVGKTADMVSISDWQFIFLCANVWFQSRIVTMMKPGHKYLLTVVSEVVQLSPNQLQLD